MRWEARFRPQVVLSAVGVMLAIPLLASLAGAEFLRASVHGVGELMDSHRFREVSGYVGLTLIVFQNLLALRKRTPVPLKGSYSGWRGVHMLVGVALLLVVVIHTGGRWGVNLNGWLLGAFVGATFVALVGKLLEACLVERQRWRRPARAPSRPWALAALEPVFARVWSRRGPGGSVGSPVTRLRTAWLGAHVLFVSALVVLLAFHIFSAYYF